MARSDAGGGARILLDPATVAELADDDPLLTEEARAARAAATGAAAGPATPAQTETPEAPAATPTEAPETPAAETPAEEEVEWSEEDIDALNRLDGYLEEQVTARERAVRSEMDKRITALQKENEARMSALTQELRATQLVGLTDDQKKALTERWAEDDKKDELTAYEKELEGYHHDLMVVAYTNEYGQYGVKETDLAELPIEEMEAVCLKAKADYLEQVISGKVPAKPAAPGQKPAAATTQAPVAARPAPAGASAPSDVGGAAPAAKGYEFKTEQNRDAMLENLKNLPVERIGKS